MKKTQVLSKNTPPRNVITLDGPAGSGKSTVARLLASRLGCAFLDTGAMYRAATWRALQLGADMDDPQALAGAARDMQLELSNRNGQTFVTVDGHDVSDAIRSPEVTRSIYKLADEPEVRKHLVELQRAWAARQPLTVAEGRDMGTIVFPEAQCKFFLEASIGERARRRLSEMQKTNQTGAFEEMQREIEERDRQDRERAAAPLKPAPDAVLIDTTSKPAEEAAGEIEQQVRRALCI